MSLTNTQESLFINSKDLSRSCIAHIGNSSSLSWYSELSCRATCSLIPHHSFLQTPLHFSTSGCGGTQYVSSYTCEISFPFSGLFLKSCSHPDIPATYVKLYRPRSNFTTWWNFPCNLGNITHLILSVVFYIALITFFYIYVFSNLFYRGQGYYINHFWILPIWLKIYQSALKGIIT